MLRPSEPRGIWPQDSVVQQWQHGILPWQARYLRKHRHFVYVLFRNPISTRADVPAILHTSPQAGVQLESL